MNTAPTAPSHERFSQACLWARQRDYFRQAGVEAWRSGQVPHYITSTAGAADVYAAAIAAYWQAALAAGDVDPQQPLYVLELGAGCGRFTYLLHKALRERLARGPALRWCCVASDIVEANLDFIASHPRLRAEVEAGRLDTAVWDAEAGGALRLRHQDLAVGAAANPVVVVANYVFDGLRHDLFGFDGGTLYEGRVAVREDLLDYLWQPVASADWLPVAWQSLLARYAGRLSGVSMLLPSGALRCMDHVGRLAPAGYLLLSADKGACTEQQLRLEPGPGFAFHGSFSLPVNYHALSAMLRQEGAWTCSGRHREDGLVHFAALRCAQPGAYEDCSARIAQALDDLDPDDHFTLKKAVEGVAHQLSAQQLLALLRLARHDARVLAFMIDALLAQAGAITGDARRLWQQALERCWANFFPLGEDDGFEQRFAAVAMALGHWGLARDALRLARALYGEDPAALHGLARCELATGRPEEALAWLEQAGDDEACGAWAARLRDRVRARAKSKWFRRTLAGDGDLVLEPLAIEHAASLLEQYRDPQIGVVTRLDELRTLEEAVAWIVEQRPAPGRIACAVMHRCWGFVGAVGLDYEGDAGYFWFWTGTDHQGAGYGRRAAALLLALAHAMGIRQVFTGAYGDNARSHAALQALGFQQLEAGAHRPDERLLFFRRAGRGGEAEAVEALRRLLQAIDSPIRLRARQPRAADPAATAPARRRAVAEPRLQAG